MLVDYGVITNSKCRNDDTGKRKKNSKAKIRLEADSFLIIRNFPSVTNTEKNMFALNIYYSKHFCCSLVAPYVSIYNRDHQPFFKLTFFVRTFCNVLKYWFIDPTTKTGQNLLFCRNHCPNLKFFHLKISLYDDFSQWVHILTAKKIVGLFYSSYKFFSSAIMLHVIVTGY